MVYVYSNGMSCESLYLVIRVSQWAAAVGIVCAVVTRGQAGRTSLKSVTGTIQTDARTAHKHTPRSTGIWWMSRRGAPLPAPRRVKGGECPLPRLLPPPTPPHADLLLTPWTTAARRYRFLSFPNRRTCRRSLSCFDRRLFRFRRNLVRANTDFLELLILALGIFVMNIFNEIKKVTVIIIIIIFICYQLSISRFYGRQNHRLKNKSLFKYKIFYIR